MSKRVVTITLIAATALTFSSSGRTSNPRIVQSAEVLALAMAHNPSLKAAVVAEARAQETIRAAQGLYPYVFDADTGYTHASTPLGQSRYRRRDGVTLGAGISKTFSVGTMADFRLEGEWYDSDVSQTVDQETAVEGSAFGLGARLSLSQPLLRGFGNRVGLSTLRQAKKAKSLVEKQADASASALAKEVLRAYWELWLAAKTVEINVRSRDVAEAQLKETADRVTLGEAAPVDKLSYQTRLASLEETVIESKAEVRRLQVVLAAKAGVIRRRTVLIPDTEESLPDAEQMAPAQEILEAALTESPSIQEAFAAIDAAREKVKVAGESMRQRLDLKGWIEARTLGADDLSPVMTDLGHGGAYSGYVGLMYELPLDNRKKQGERAQARLEVEIAAEQLKSTEDQVRSDIAVALDAIDAAKQRLSMAEETLDLAQQQADAEKERYRLGAAIFTAVRDAEEAVREAELRLTRARVDIVQSQIEIHHLTGDLLGRLAYRR